MELVYIPSSFLCPVDSMVESSKASEKFSEFFKMLFFGGTSQVFTLALVVLKICAGGTLLTIKDMISPYGSDLLPPEINTVS